MPPHKYLGRPKICDQVTETGETTGLKEMGKMESGSADSTVFGSLLGCAFIIIVVHLNSISHLLIALQIHIEYRMKLLLISIAYHS